jgi:hypothetical protein
VDQTQQLALDIVSASTEIERLAKSRVAITKDLEAIRLREARKVGPSAHAAFEQSVAMCETKLAGLERDIQFQRSKVRAARSALVKKNTSLDAALEEEEARAHRSRRPPVGQGVRLSEEDFRRAQNSVPQVAFVVAVLAVVVMALFTVSALSLPTVLSAVLACIGLALTAVFGIGGLVYARRADIRATRDEQRRLSAETTGGSGS